MKYTYLGGFILNKSYLEKLEYNKVLEILATYSKTYIGKELCLSLEPFYEKSKVLKALQETTEANSLIQRKGNVPISSIENCDVFKSYKRRYYSFY